jgi:DNA invertase Pin-like site-specific DNA recombinase
VFRSKVGRRTVGHALQTPTEHLETLKRHDVSLSSTSEGLDGADSAIVQHVANMIASFAEFERDLISERLRDANAAKRRQGLRCAGLVSFGFAAAPATRQLQPVPGWSSNGRGGAR